MTLFCTKLAKIDFAKLKLFIVRIYDRSERAQVAVAAAFVLISLHVLNRKKTRNKAGKKEHNTRIHLDILYIYSLCTLHTLAKKK